jgi:hypothetical protein
MRFDTNPNDTFWRQLVMPEEARRAHPLAPAWRGGYRWYESNNVVDLQKYRSAFEKERICRVLLWIRTP